MKCVYACPGSKREVVGRREPGGGMRYASGQAAAQVNGNAVFCRGGMPPTRRTREAGDGRRRRYYMVVCPVRTRVVNGVMSVVPAGAARGGRWGVGMGAGRGQLRGVWQRSVRQARSATVAANR